MVTIAFAEKNCLDSAIHQVRKATEHISDVKITTFKILGVVRIEHPGAVSFEQMRDILRTCGGINPETIGPDVGLKITD